jgi:hypothetical protein
MSDHPGGYLPSAASVIGAYAAALNQLWDLPLSWYKALAESAFSEDIKLTTRSTTVFIPRPDADLTLAVSATRWEPESGTSHSVQGVCIDPKTIRAKAPGRTRNIEVQVFLRDRVARGAYLVEFREQGTGQLVESRILNFGV